MKKSKITNDRKHFKLNSVKKKMIAGFVLLTLINVIAFLGFQMHSAYALLGEEALDKSYAYAEHIEKIISPIGLKQPEKLQNKITDLRNTQYKTSGYVGVLDKDLKYIANTDPSKIGTEFKIEETENAIKNNKSASFAIGNNGKKEYLSVVPLYSVTMVGDVDSVASATAKIDIPGIVVVSMDTDLMITRQIVEIEKIAGIGFGLLALSILVAVIISNTITKPLYIIRKHLHTTANGDFRSIVSVKSNDELFELAEDINTANSVLKDMIGDIKATSDELDKYSQELTNSTGSIYSTSDEISESMNAVAGRTTQQAARLSDTSDAINQFSDNLESINSRVQGIEESSVQIKDVADMGSNRISELHSTMRKVQGNFEAVKNKIELLSASVGQIHSITETINTVAKQTNLLSLNASIEAARAGEAGSGFVVVAQEVKKLAEQTLSASQDISKLVADIREGTKTVSDTTAGAIESVESESISINETISVFNNIVEQINKIIPNINDAASELQLAMDAKGDILTNVKSISSMSEEIAASSEEVSASIQEQSAIVQNLTCLSDRLRKTSKDMVQDTEKFKTS